MVQESIVEYINAQMKLGVSRDSIKSTLVGAGWVAADVEDTLKKVEAAKTAQPAAPVIVAKSPAAVMPVTASPSSSFSAAKPMMSASGGAAANPAPQTIKVSDLISAAPTSSTPISAKPAGPKSPLTGPAASTSSVSMAAVMPAGKKTADTFQALPMMGAKPHASRGALITEVVLVIIILAVGGFAGFLFMQNNSLNAQLGSLNGQSSGVNSQLSALQAQVAASTTALTAQVSSLTADNQGLQTELSFIAVPAGMTPGATSSATVSGTVAMGKAGYIITTAHNVKIFVANSKAASVIAALTALIAPAPAATASSTATVATSNAATSTAVVAPAAPAPTVAQFTGTYVLGSDTITLTSVNGTSL